MQYDKLLWRMATWIRRPPSKNNDPIPLRVIRDKGPKGGCMCKTLVWRRFINELRHTGELPPYFDGRGKRCGTCHILTCERAIQHRKVNIQ